MKLTEQQLRERLKGLVDLGREIQANAGDSFYKNAAQADADTEIDRQIKDLMEEA